MIELTCDQVDCISGGDGANSLLVGIVVDVIVGHIVNTIRNAQYDGVQMSDLQAP